MKPGSKAWKAFMAKLYGFGAAVVIVGAMFKIMHWPFAGEMLVVGLSTEAVIFIFSAFEPIHEDPDWTLVYPELAMGHDGHDHGHDKKHDKKHAIAAVHEEEPAGDSITEQLDKMLEDAKIEPELIASLGEGLRSLSDSAGKLGDISGATLATEGYIASMRGASDKVSKLSDTYDKASESLLGLTSSAAEGQSFGEQLVKVSSNLAALNNVYELQLKGSSESLEAQQRLQGGITELMNNLSSSIEDTRLYKENMAMLAQNLTALNTVYGNMLNAMTIRA
jgi:gliding motility-associated protein GldL